MCLKSNDSNKKIKHDSHERKKANQSSSSNKQTNTSIIIKVAGIVYLQVVNLQGFDIWIPNHAFWACGAVRPGYLVAIQVHRQIEAVLVCSRLNGCPVRRVNVIVDVVYVEARSVAHTAKVQHLSAATLGARRHSRRCRRVSARGKRLSRRRRHRLLLLLPRRYRRVMILLLRLECLLLLVRLSPAILVLKL